MDEANTLLKDAAAVISEALLVKAFLAKEASAEVAAQMARMAQNKVENINLVILKEAGHHIFFLEGNSKNKASPGPVTDIRIETALAASNCSCFGAL